METKTALRWALTYRVLSFCAGLVGLLVAGIGVIVGAGGISAALAGDVTAMSATGSTLAMAVLVALGFGIWRVGTTLAFYKTLTEAVDEQMAERFDAEKVKSEILEVLDERLSEIQHEVEQTRRGVNNLDSPEALDFED